MIRFAMCAVVFATLLASGCLDDSPVTPRPEARISFHVSLQATRPGQSIQARVFFITQREEQERTLFTHTFGVTGGPQQLAVSFDLTSCLPFFTPDTVGPYCDVDVQLQLFDNGTEVDSRFIGPVRVRPGEAAPSPTVFLVSGNTAPVLSTIDTAVLVEPGLIRYEVSGSDADGDLIAVTARALDPNNALIGSTTNTFPRMYSTFSGPLYAFVPEFSGVQNLEVFVEDTKANFSAFKSHSVDSVRETLEVFGLSTDTTADSVHLKITIADEVGAGDSVEVLFRNQVDQFTTADTLYFVCGQRFTPGVDTVRVACKRQVPFDRAEAIVVPFTSAGGWGLGSRCGVPGDCFSPGFRRARE